MGEDSGGATFLSYAREDSDFALRLVKVLRAAGTNVWMDQLEISAGQNWDAAVDDALKVCSRLLLVLSPAAVTSANVMNEIRFALDRKKTIIPILYRDCEIPHQLSRLQWIDFRGGDTNASAALVQRLSQETHKWRKESIQDWFAHERDLRDRWNAQDGGKREQSSYVKADPFQLNLHLSYSQGFEQGPIIQRAGDWPPIMDDPGKVGSFTADPERQRIGTNYVSDSEQQEHSEDLFLLFAANYLMFAAL